MIADTRPSPSNRYRPGYCVGTRVERLRIWFILLRGPCLKLGVHRSQKKLASVDGVDICEINITYDNDENSPNSVEMPLSNEKFSQLQMADEKVKNLKNQSQQWRIFRLLTKIENNILYRMVVEKQPQIQGNSPFWPKLINTALFSRTQPKVGHNGFPENICSYQTSLLLEGVCARIF